MSVTASRISLLTQLRQPTRRAVHVLHAETVVSAEVETVATVAAAVVAVAVAMTVRLNKEYSDTEYKIEWRENFRPLFFCVLACHD